MLTPLNTGAGRWGRWIAASALLTLLALSLVAGCTTSKEPTATQSELDPTTVAVQDGVLAIASTPTSPGLKSTAASPSPTPQPSPTATPTPTPTPTATATATPTVTPSPTATATPVLRRLTSGGCCTQPFWSPDSEQVLYIDQPEPEAPVGIWGVSVEASGATPHLFTERIALYTSDMDFVVEPIGNTTYIERLDGPDSGTERARWSVPANGRPVTLSPQRTRIAWQVSNSDLPVEQRLTQIWIANLDGSEAQQITTLARGGLISWLSEEVLLLSRRESLQSQETIIYTLSLADGAQVELVRADRPRGALLSPDRRWIAYFITFSDEPEQNGLWLVRADGTQRLQLGRELFGAYQWRDADRLILVPFQPDAVYLAFWEYGVETGEARQLTDPGVTPIQIANGDWQVSPDGQYVAFVAEGDRNIWLLKLPD